VNRQIDDLISIESIKTKQLSLPTITWSNAGFLNCLLYPFYQATERGVSLPGSR